MSVLSEYRKETAPQDGKMHALPLGAYSDPEVFDLEMERVFRGDWFAVCGADELPNPGDYFAFTVATEPIVVIRSVDGVLRAFSNVCRHRGTVLYDEGRGNASRVQCPYHAWSYDSCGKLRGVPYPGDAEIDKASHGLVSIRLENWKGIVFINFAADAEALAPRLSGLDRYLDPFQYDRFASAPAMPMESWKSNWKLVMENSMDWYHLFKTHPQSLNHIAATGDAFNLEGSPCWTASASPLTHAPPKRSDDPASLGDFEREHYFVLSIPPNLTFFANAESWAWLLVLPLSVDQTVVCGGGRFSEHQDGPLAAEIQTYDQVMEEDRILCERLQRGMSSRHSRGGQLIELDRPIKDFHHYLGWRLFDHELAAAWETKASPELRVAGG